MSAGGRRRLEVVICTYNNASMLDEMLLTRSAASAPLRGRWSCLVVDNNCTDETQQLSSGIGRPGGFPAFDRCGNRSRD